MRTTETYGLTAPPEVVFGVLTDPDRVNRWLPAGFEAEMAGRERIRIRAGRQVREYQVTVVPAELRLDLWSVGGPQLRGAVSVADGPVGGSRLQVEVTGAAPDPPEDRVRQFLADTVRHLQRDVSDNFNAG